MFKKLLLLFTILLLSLSACDLGGDSEEDGADNTNTGDGTYSFIDQDLQGTFSGEDWNFVSGTAELSSWDGDWDFTLYDVNYTGDNPFDLWAYYGIYEKKIMFSVPGSNTVGVYELQFSLTDSENNKTATFYDSIDGMNTIAGDGAIEIVSIDDVAKTITGRLHIWFGSDKGNYEVNGNFTVPYEE